MMMEAVVLMALNFYGQSWNKEQIRETAELIIEEFWWLQVAELKHFLTRVKMGGFDKLYSANQFTPPILLKWLGEYADESWRIRSQSGYINAQSDKVEERTSSRDMPQDAAKEAIYQAQKVEQMQRELANKMKGENPQA
jgi:hypothetical protein